MRLGDLVAHSDDPAQFTCVRMLVCVADLRGCSPCGWKFVDVHIFNPSYARSGWGKAKVLVLALHLGQPSQANIPLFAVLSLLHLMGPVIHPDDSAPILTRNIQQKGIG